MKQTKLDRQVNRHAVLCRSSNSIWLNQGTESWKYTSYRSTFTTFEWLSFRVPAGSTPSLYGRYTCVPPFDSDKTIGRLRNQTTEVQKQRITVLITRRLWWLLSEGIKSTEKKALSSNQKGASRTAMCPSYSRRLSLLGYRFNRFWHISCIFNSLMHCTMSGTTTRYSAPHTLVGRSHTLQ